jgi:hypothetical protein
MDNTSSSYSSGFASLPNLSSLTNDLPDPDDDFVLFPEDDDKDPTNFTKPGEFSKKGVLKNSDEEEQYILGTIIIRVVAARGLENPNYGGISTGFFNRSNRSSSSSSATINPYASVKFGTSTQRGSEVYSSLDPVFPRDEIMFMDVSVPLSQLTHCSSKNQINDGEAHASSSSSSPINENNEDLYSAYNKPDNTILTVALFHIPLEMGGNIPNKKKLHNDGTSSGDSDDTFLGMASIDLIQLLTGQRPVLDEWLPLHGTSNDISTGRSSKAGASVRIICEYELSDVPPNAGDIYRFNRFCHPKDLYPLEPGGSYRVDKVHNNGEIVLLSYESRERWVLSFQANKKMLVCEERHVSALNTAQDELQTLGERLSVSPLVAVVTETAERVVEDGLVGVAEGIVRGSASIFDRWFKGGIDTIISDIQDVTNIDGRHNQDNIGRRLDLESPTSSSSSLVDDNNDNNDNNKAYSTIDAEDPFQEKQLAEALPNMPPCPITGFPMVSNIRISKLTIDLYSILPNRTEKTFIILSSLYL